MSYFFVLFFEHSARRMSAKMSLETAEPRELAISAITGNVSKRQGYNGS